MKFFNLHKRFWQWALLLFVSFIWGASFILMKRSLESFSSIQVGTLRIFFAFLFLLPLFIKRFKKFPKKHIKSLLIVAFIGNLLPAILFALAQTEISSSLSGMLNTMFPIIALIIGALFYGIKTEKHRILGIVIGLLGTIGIVLSGDSDFTGNNNYSLYIFLAVVFYAFSINEIKYNLAEIDGVSITVFAFMIIGPVSGVYLLFSDFSSATATPDYLENLGYIVLLALGGSAVSVTLFYLLMDYVDVVFASLTTYIIPVFAIFWGIFDGEVITIVQMLFMFLIFAGIFLVNKKKQKISK
ncbi:MAG: DMT family transporter [Bacteroidales bacterium]|nr:DMT family transporter [Bacteroidales bacterium]